MSSIWRCIGKLLHSGCFNEQKIPYGYVYLSDTEIAIATNDSFDNLMTGFNTTFASKLYPFDDLDEAFEFEMLPKEFN